MPAALAAVPSTARGGTARGNAGTGLRWATSLPPERLVDFVPDIAAGDPDIAKHAIVQPGELRALPAAPTPFPQRRENSAQRLPHREPQGTPSHLPQGYAGTVSRCRSERNSLHAKLLVWRSGSRYGSAPLFRSLAVRSRMAGVSALSGSCGVVRTTALPSNMR